MLQSPVAGHCLPCDYVVFLGFGGLGLLRSVIGATIARSRPTFFLWGDFFSWVLGFSFGHDSTSDFSQLFQQFITCLALFL